MARIKNILVLFFRNEQKVFRLYNIYSHRIPKYKNFWKRLAEEEKEHVRILKEVNSKNDSQKDLFKADKHIFEIVEYVGNFLDEEIEKAKTGNFSQEDAFLTALRLEQSMVEKKCFEIVQPQKEEVREVFQKLNRETRQHYQSILNEFQSWNR